MLMGFAKDLQHGCVVKFHLSFNQQSWKWVSREGTTSRWLLLSFGGFFSPTSDEAERSKQAWNTASVFLLCCLKTHADKLWQDDGAAPGSLLTCREWVGRMRRGGRSMFEVCVGTIDHPWPEQPLCVHVCQDESPLWSIRLWSAVTVPMQPLVQSDARVAAPWLMQSDSLGKRKKKWTHP